MCEYPVGLAIIAAFFAAVPSFAAAATTTPHTDAVAIYRRANEAITVDSPAATSMTYPDFPPFGSDWIRVAQDAWEHDGRARELAHEARQVISGHVPDASPDGIKGMNALRNLANNLADAAEYEHQKGDDAAALGSILDLLHIPETLRRNAPPGNAVCTLVASGIDALASYHLDVIASSIKVTADPADGTSAQRSVVRAMILQLLNLVSPDQEMAQFDRQSLEKLLLKEPIKSTLSADQQLALLRETFSRCDAGRITAAISLAAHLFKYDHHRWPAAMAELIPVYLPAIPMDYWGNGHQAFGYALIPAGLPDGLDRPLVFNRCRSRDGFFYRVDQPEYGFYNGDGSALPPRQQKQGGQFYDIAAWVPEKRITRGPTTHPFKPPEN